MKRTISWFDPHTSAEAAIARQAVISQFFFNTDVRTIRPADNFVLNKLILHLRNNLRERRVELALVGHADHRGKEAYNMDLAHDRCEAIASVLNRELRHTQKYSHISGTAMGEARATQQSKDAAVLDWDRRVDVYSSSLIYAWPDIRNKMKFIPGVMRISHMEWIKADYKAPSTRPEGLGDFIKGKAVDWIVSKILPEENPLAPGKEREWERRLREVDPAYRVTAVKITAMDEDALGMLSSLTTKVTYTWGVPTPNITVNYEYRSTNWIGFGERKERAKLTLSRSAAERSPFYFPQVNWRPIQVGRR